jgi:DNA invertase Pin-like site-specific DNA recombinase
VIAKLDRLARNVAFVSNLMESGVEFMAVDFPQANRLTIHILAAVAEHEAKAISERTRAALAAGSSRRHAESATGEEAVQELRSFCTPACTMVSYDLRLISSGWLAWATNGSLSRG